MKKWSAHGLTLVELLVTVSVMGILFAIGIAKYNEFNQRQILSQAVLELKANIRLAQDKALAGEKDCAVSACGGVTDGCSNDRVEPSLDGWYLNFLDDSGYQIYGKCGNNEFRKKTVDLAAKHITVGSNLVRIRFRTLGYGPDFDNETITEVVITLAGFGLPSQAVRITRSGEIR